MSLTVGSLFTGIGGFDLGFQRAGMSVRWQVEIDPYCIQVLEKNFPGVKHYGDITKIDWSTVEPVDLLCGGFPCQPHSLAGKRKASDDERNLWPEFYRAIRALKPRWIVVENVRGLLSSETGQFFGGILRDLARSGYDAEWRVLSAAQFGAPHIRERVWIVAHATDHPILHDQFRKEEPPFDTSGNGEIGILADTKCYGREQRTEIFCSRKSVFTLPGGNAGRLSQPGRGEVSEYWKFEPDVGRVANGVPSRLDRLRGLGNALVPQIAEWIGGRIIEHYIRVRLEPAKPIDIV